MTAISPTAAGPKPAGQCRRVCGTVAALLTLAVPAILFIAADPAKMAPAHWTALRFVAWLLCMVGFFWLFIAIGAAVKGRPLGVLINERNRYSLSRLQMTLWTMLILSSLYIILLNNVYRSDGDAKFDFNWELIVLMGASVGSVVTTPMILSRKSDNAPSAALPAATGALDANTDPHEAGMVDLVVGEEVSNVDDIDIGRIQMLMMTLVAVTIYAWEVGVMLLSLDTQTDLFVPQMPDLNQTLLGLILVSHAGYLGGKFTPSANSRNATAAQMGRALQLSQKTTDLVRRAEQAAKDAAAGSAAATQLNNLLPLLRSLAVEAGALPSQAGTDKFDADAIAKLEGKVEAASGQFALITGATGQSSATQAPVPAVVSQVQALLARLPGVTGVVPTGTADAPTMAAIDTVLKQKNLSRSDLSPQPDRLFEELQELLA